MIKLTVQQYANKCNTSVQQIYRQIKKGSLTVVKENNITLILTEDKEVKQITNKDKHNVNDLFINHLVKDNKQLNKQLKTKDKEIKRLTKELSKVTQTKENLYEKVLGYTIEHKPQEDIEVVTTNDKKKKKAKKKKDKK